MVFGIKNVSHYVIAFGLIYVGSTLIANTKEKLETNDEYKIIQDYLLNESPLYGYNRPKLWIHSKYEINARTWKDFQSRNTTDLNQPYLHLIIKSIINHCGDDFNVCLIDDESFNKLLPEWDVNVRSMPEPTKSQYRELGMARLLEIYGGLVVPNSFLCIKNLKPMYDDMVSNGKPFVCESINKTCDMINRTTDKPFIPNTYIMGAPKNDKYMKELIEFIKSTNKTHPTTECDFVGSLSIKCQQMISDNKIDLIGGEKVGIKTTKGDQIVLDNLMEEAYLDIDNRTVGIYIPADEVLQRTKYQWFAVLPSNQVLQSKMIISKYILASMVDSTNEYYKSSKIHSVVTI
jgi:hypothetical protein